MGEFGSDGDDFGTASGSETSSDVSEDTTETTTSETGNTGEITSGATDEVDAEVGHGMCVEDTSVTTNSEFSVNSNFTNQGTNQILETPTSMEQAQQSVENYHQQSLGQIMEMNGQFIPDSQKERLPDEPG